MTRPVTRQAAAETREKEKRERERQEAQQQVDVEKKYSTEAKSGSQGQTRGVQGGAKGRQRRNGSSWGKDSEKTATQPPATEQANAGARKDDKSKLPSSGKRRRPVSISPSPERQDKRRKRASVPPQRGIRPGVPAPVNPRSFVRTDRPSGPDHGDDEHGHFQYALGESITSRYKILSKMGEGTFGRVLECWDRKNKTYVAIKLVRSLPKYRDAAMQELEVLNTLIANDPEGRYHCVRMLEWFDYRRHVCIVFEKLGLSLFDFLRWNNYFAFNIDLVRQIGRQLLRNVAYLHDLRLIHTDLKPENIMLKSADNDKYSQGRRKSMIRVPKDSAIKVIDYGSAIFEDQHHSSVVSTRHYRAPEVILGLGWSFSVDIWSVGCILVELTTGSALFQTHDNAEHLAMMQQVLGPIPESLAALAIRKVDSKYFKRNRLRWPFLAEDKKSIQAVKELASLRKMLLNDGHPSVKDRLDDLVDIVKQMMRYDPSARIGASQALEHPFFRHEGPGQRGSTEDRRSLRSQSSDVIVLDE